MNRTRPKWIRPDKLNHYLNRAKVAAERSTCQRRRVGAIIVKNDVVISSGYVGSPRGMDNCIDLEKCLRVELSIPSGQNYELCRSVHAEQNAIINAARSGVNIINGEMYVSSERIGIRYNKRNKKTQKVYGPCQICKKEIINAGLKKVYMREEGLGDETYNIDELKENLKKEEEEIKKDIS